MKNIRFYNASKYASAPYEKVAENIFKTIEEPQGNNLSLKGINDEVLIKKLEHTSGWIDGVSLAERNFQINCVEGVKYYRNKKPRGNRGITYFTLMDPQIIYVTSMMFEQEVEYGENDPSDEVISQYPLEDILDKFYVYCLDAYKEENTTDKVNSYVEFASEKLEDIQALTEIVGKHVYNKEDGKYIKLVIE